MRDYIYQLMTDRIDGAVANALKGMLYVLSLLYGAAIFIRGLFYRYGIFKTERAPIKIISVGNLTLGGTGKTPFVINLAETLRDNLKKEVAILIRGYGWDEQAMLKRSLPEMPILVGEDRAKAAHRSIKLYGSDTAILDDGFQYRQLHRDLDIVLIDSRNPFGNGHLFPRGILREPKESVRRADIAVFTKVNKSAVDLNMMKEGLKRINGKLNFLEAVHKPIYFYDTRGKRLELSVIEGKRLMLISSIGDPGYFEDIMKDLKANVVEHIVFEDHHDYTESDIERIMQKCDERSFDMIITTEKDIVKLQRMHYSFGTYILLILAIEIEILSGKEMLIDRLHSLYSR